MAEFTRKDVTWVWRNRLAAGKSCIVAGDPGEGKSTMLCQVAAMISRGAKLPDDDEAHAPKDVLFISAEDDPADTVLDRLAAAHADMSRIFWVDGVRRDSDGNPQGFFSVIDDLDRLEGTLTQSGRDFALVILDPFDAYLGVVPIDLVDKVRAR
jgi:RecA-family ATPase